MSLIPKIIHYCWFGKGAKPSIVKLCINSWKKCCPDYEIKEWNEDNFSLNTFPFAKQAYERKKYAFVADVARLHALVSEGGIYLDTDVFLLKHFPEEMLQFPAFLGFEQNGICLGTALMACAPGNIFFQRFLAFYEQKKFVRESGTLEITPNVFYLTDLLKEQGLIMNNRMQNVGELAIYPAKYFSPMTPQKSTRSLNVVDETVCVHLFYASWKNYSLVKKLKVIINQSIQRFNLWRYSR